MICQTCGSTGFSNALLQCTICTTTVEHQYCLEKIPTADEVMRWICRECKPKPPKFEVKQCTEMKKLVQEIKQISPKKNSQPDKRSNQKMSAEAKFGSAWESLDFISHQPHPLGDKSNSPSVNCYGICHDDLGHFSPQRIQNYLHSPIKQFETAKLSILEASKSSLKHEDDTTSTSSCCVPSEFMCTLQNDAYEKSKFEAASLVENWGTSAELSRKPSDHERFMRSRRRILLPEENQLDQVHEVNIIDDESRRKISNENLIVQATDHASTLEQGKRTFSSSDNKSEPTIISQNVQEETLHAHENLMLQVVDHASAIGENNPGEVLDKSQSVSATDRAEQESLRQKRKLIKSSEDQSDVHAIIIDEDVSRERLLTNKSVPAVGHHAPVFQNDAPAVTCDRSQAASLECNRENFSALAQPIMQQIWRGCFDVCDQEYGPLVAHLSNKACARVWTTSRLLPPVLKMIKLSQSEAWPKSFKTLPPTDDSIALYFFAQDDSIEVAVKELLDEVIKKDLALKIVLDEAELLVFPSIILPENSQRFQQKYYLWGAFRGRETGLTNIVMTSPSIEYPWLKPLRELKELEMRKRQQRIGTLPEHVGVMKGTTSTAKGRKTWANAKRRVEYQVGDLVLAKLSSRRDNGNTVHRRQNQHYEGPFLIEKKLGKMTYKLRIPRTLQQHSIFHASLLKLHHWSKGNPNRRRRRWKKSSKSHEDFNWGRSQLEHGGISTSRGQFQTP